MKVDLWHIDGGLAPNTPGEVGESIQPVGQLKREPIERLMVPPSGHTPVWWTRLMSGLGRSLDHLILELGWREIANRGVKSPA
ncbi:MAG: hypothetical protein ACI9MR_004882, partial [Myxococcota bacterium]